MVRKITAIVVGIIAGMIFNMSFVIISNVAYPLPDDIDQNDWDAQVEYRKENGWPMGALVLVLIAHAGGSLASGIVCGLIAMRNWTAAGLGLGIFFTLGGITMLFLLPAPTWFAITDIVLYIPAAIVGVMIGGALMGNKLAEPAKAK